MTLSQQTIIMSALFTITTNCMVATEVQQKKQSINFTTIAQLLIKDNATDAHKTYACWNPKYPVLAVGTHEDLMLLDGTTGQFKNYGHNNISIAPICFSLNGSRMISKSDKKDITGSMIMLHHGITGKCIKHLNAHQNSLYAFSPDSLQIVQSIPMHKKNKVDVSAKFMIYDAITGKLLQQCSHKSTISSLFFKNNIEFIDNTGIRNFDKKQLLSFKNNIGKINHIALSPNTSRIATSSVNVTLKDQKNHDLILRDGDGDTIQTIDNTKYTTALSFSPDSKHLIIADCSGTITVWDAQNGNLIDDVCLSKNQPISIDEFTFIPNTPLFIATCQREFIIFNSTNYKPIFTAPNSEFLAISPDGKYMALKRFNRTDQQFMIMAIHK